MLHERRGPELNRGTGVCRPLPTHPAPPPSEHAARVCIPSTGRIRADDGIRTRDPHLGKVVLYQLSHVRLRAGRRLIEARLSPKLLQPRLGTRGAEPTL